MIRVLVVDDAPALRKRIVEVLSLHGFEVVGEAPDGETAIGLASTLVPDVITLDLVDATAVVESIMARAPLPIVVVSAQHDPAALAAGAVEAIDKRPDLPGWAAKLASAVRIASRVKVITHPRGRLPLARGSGRMPKLRRLGAPANQSGEKIDLVAIGASSGGPRALLRILSTLPPSFALPIAVVLHVEPSFAVAFADWLRAHAGRPVRFACDDEPLAPGVILAPPDRHLVVSGARLRLTDDPPRNFWRPSIDVLFESIAAERARTTAACLLTGMGRDGASGLLAIRRHGGLTIAQDEASCAVFGMPREAIACGAATHVLPLDDIGPTIRSLGKCDEHDLDRRR